MMDGDDSSRGRDRLCDVAPTRKGLGEEEEVKAISQRSVSLPSADAQ